MEGVGGLGRFAGLCGGGGHGSSSLQKVAGDQYGWIYPLNNTGVKRLVMGIGTSKPQNRGLSYMPFGESFRGNRWKLSLN
jgi:hypothetical protein